MKYNFQIYDESEAGINSPMLLVQSSKSNEYGHFVIRPVWKDNNGKIRFYNHMSESILEDLEITCQWNLFEDGDLKTPYAWRLAYDYKMEMNHLDYAMQKIGFMKKIESKMDKIRQEFGSADDFETYVVRIASAMGIKVFIVNHYDNPEDYTAHDIKGKIKSIYTK